MVGSVQCFGVIMCFWFAGGTTSNTCNFNVKMKQVLHNEGFHRNITYGIVFSGDDERDRWLYEDCIVAVEQELPRGVFVKADELRDLRRMNKLNAVPKEVVDEELPASKTVPSSVYVIGTLTDSKAYLWLPVHARYHDAAYGGGTARNEISSPQLFLRCRDQRLEVCDRVMSYTSFRCNGSNNKFCSWKVIPYTMMTDTLVWDVPVGDSSHYYAVAAGTAAVIIVASLYLLSAIHEYQRARKKC